MALRMEGIVIMRARPEMVRDANQTSIIGPKAPDTLSVPLNWTAKSPTAMTMAITSSVHWCVSSRPGIKTRPSTADRIEMAGVMTPSPSRRQTPI